MLSKLINPYIDLNDNLTRINNMVKVWRHFLDVTSNVLAFKIKPVQIFRGGNQFRKCFFILQPKRQPGAGARKAQNLNLFNNPFLFFTTKFNTANLYSTRFLFNPQNHIVPLEYFSGGTLSEYIESILYLCILASMIKVV